MKEIDRMAIEEWGIAGLVLMENAGRAVVDALEKELGEVKKQRFLVVCGKGNNGGDGFVITRHLLNRGAEVNCFILGKIDELKGDARTNAQILINNGYEIIEVSTLDELSRLLALTSRASVVIDAIFGTGLSSPPQGIFAKVIQLLNESGNYVVSVDIPSGIDADTGGVLEPAIRADLTVTMGVPKYGLLLYPGRAYAGKLIVADIGIPYQLLKERTKTFLIDEEFVRQNLPRRPADGHKGSFGSCLLLCGSRGYSGACVLAGMAAVRSGAGLIHLGYPKGISQVIESCAIEPVKHPLPETDSETLSPAALPFILELLSKVDSIAIGPGISTHPETKKLLLELLPRLEKPTVIDADGLNNFAGAIEILKEVKAPLILTPHPGELSRLISKNPAEINANRITVAREFALNHKCVLVLKGAPTVIATPDGQVFVNPTGNSGLASGGTGDVLTGLLAGLIAQGASPINAALIGTFLHGLAGDIGAEELTGYSLAAGDLLNYIPKALAKILLAQ